MHCAQHTTVITCSSSGYMSGRRMGTAEIKQNWHGGMRAMCICRWQQVGQVAQRTINTLLGTADGASRRDEAQWHCETKGWLSSAATLLIRCATAKQAGAGDRDGSWEQRRFGAALESRVRCGRCHLCMTRMHARQANKRGGGGGGGAGPGSAGARRRCAVSFSWKSVSRWRNQF